MLWSPLVQSRLQVSVYKSHDKINDTINSCLTKTYLHQKSYCHTIYLVEAGGGYVTLNLDILFREKACTELKFARQSEKYKNEIKLLLITWFA